MPTYSRRGGCAYPIGDRVKLDFLADRFDTAPDNPPNALIRLVTLRRTIRKLKPDVIVSFLTNVNIAALVATVGLDVPVIVSERSFPPRQKLSMYWRILRRVSYWRAAAVVAQTDGVSRWLQRKCPGIKTVIIPNPVVLPVQDGEPRLAPDIFLARGRRMILSVGRCVPEKGFDRLIEAFAQIAPELTDCDLVILGEGPERPSLERLCEVYGIANRVHFPGHVGNVGDWYAEASVFVMTSHFEGFPNALLECMAHGVPAVSVACDTGPEDIVRDGIDGFLIANDSDATAIAGAVIQIMRDDAARVALGQRALEVVERYSMNSVAASWNALMTAAQSRDKFLPDSTGSGR